VGDAPKLYRAKGVMFRAHVEYLEKIGKLDAVLERVLPETMALARNLPLPGSWIDGWHLNELVQGLYEMEGTAGARRLIQGVVDGRMMSILLPVIKAVMRVLGGSPAILFARYGDVLQRHIEGLDFQWTQTDEDGGTVVLHFHTERKLLMSHFLCAVQGLHVVFQICSVHGTVSEPEIIDSQTARYQVHWEKN